MQFVRDLVASGELVKAVNKKVKDVWETAI
jgi:hypothetical protein